MASIQCSTSCRTQATLKVGLHLAKAGWQRCNVACVTRRADVCHQRHVDVGATDTLDQRPIGLPKASGMRIHHCPKDAVRQPAVTSNSNNDNVLCRGQGDVAVDDLLLYHTYVEFPGNIGCSNIAATNHRKREPGCELSGSLGLKPALKFGNLPRLNRTYSSVRNDR